jgi:hypothetical protein
VEKHPSVFKIFEFFKSFSFSFSLQLENTQLFEFCLLIVAVHDVLVDQVVLTIARLQLVDVSVQAFVNILNRIYLHLSEEGAYEDTRGKLNLEQGIKLLELILKLIDTSDWSGDRVFVF